MNNQNNNQDEIQKTEVERWSQVFLKLDKLDEEVLEDNRSSKLDSLFWAIGSATVLWAIANGIE